MKRTVRVYRFLLLWAAMLLATMAAGWIGVPLAATAFAVIDRGVRVSGETALAAGAAWAAMFVAHVMAWLVAEAPGPSMIRTVAAVVGMPSFVAPLLTIVFPALLAWAAATVTVALLHIAGRPRRAPGLAPHPAD